MKPQRAMTPPKSWLRRRAARTAHRMGAWGGGEGARRWLSSPALARQRGGIGGCIDESVEADPGHRIVPAGWIGRCTLLSAGGGKT